MNQDQVKEILLKIDSNVAEFKVIFSGKNSKKVDGLYHPDTCEIIIHNRNFTSDNALLYTAIHEFAHHIQFTRNQAPVTMRSHTVAFWDTFHRLLKSAEDKKLYTNIFENDNSFIELTHKIKEEYLSKNGEIMKDFGKVLIQALDLCQQKHAIFEDYVDRVLGLNRSVAKSIMKIFALDISPEIGFDNMRIAAGVKEPEIRQEIVKSFQDGKSQQMIRQELKENRPQQEQTLNRLLAQKKRIEKSILSLQERLEDVVTQIDEKSQEEGDPVQS